MQRTAMVLLLVMAMVLGTVTTAAAHARRTAAGRLPVAGLVVTESTRGFGATYDALLTALRGNPAITVVAEVDHAANARRAGLRLPPTREVFFGNPNLGTPVLQADQVAGIDLPQKMLIWQEQDRVFVAYNAAEYLVARHDVAGVATLDTIAGALATLTSIATGVDVDQIGATRAAVRRLRRTSREPGLRSLPSSFPVDETVDRLTAAIQAAPPELVFVLDHEANAASVGQSLRPTTLLVFGGPALGTPLMQRRRTAGIDLPQKFLVHEAEDGDVLITWNDPLAIARRHLLPDERATLEAIATALENLAAAAAS